MPQQINTNTRSGLASVAVLLYVPCFVFYLGSVIGLTLGMWPFVGGFWGFLPAAMYALFLSIPTTLILGSWYVLRTNARYQRERNAAAAVQAETASAPMTPEDLAEWRKGFDGLHVGKSAGILAGRGHNAGLNAGEDLWLSPEDCAKNIIVFGGIGAGKTTRMINPMLSGVLLQDCGALIFDIKTDYADTVKAVAKSMKREVKIVGDGGLTLNLFRGCSPELAASYLKSCFLAQGQGHGDSAFWVDSAVECCRHGLNLLNLLDPPHYSIAGVYDVVFDDEVRGKLLADGAARFETFSDRNQRLFLQSQKFFVNVWDKHDEKLRRNVMGTINAVLSPFAHPDLVDAFSQGSPQGEADISELIRDGAVFVVNLPMTKFGREGARFAYLLIKLRFFDLMRGRKQHPDWNQTRHVAFLCDEYQAIVDPVSDVDFWDKSRSTKTVGIVSMQGVSSLIQALNGNRQAADAILQNFRQRVVFRSEDGATLNMVKSTLGQVDVETLSENYGESKSYDSEGIKVSENAGEGYSLSRQDLYSANDMRSLDADHCIFVGNVGNRAVDEVLAVKPLYVD